MADVRQNNDHGGLRRPMHPAAVSGPGRYSHRTDGQPGQSISTAPDQSYGDVKDQVEQQRVQRLAAASPPPPVPRVSLPSQQSAPNGPVSSGGSSYQGGPFNAPTARPDEPVTAGVPSGPGPGPEVLSTPQPPSAPATGAVTAMLQSLAPTDSTGVLANLLSRAQALGV